MLWMKSSKKLKMQKINPNKLWEWILGRPQPKKAVGKPLQLIKESFDYKEWDQKINPSWLSSENYSDLKSKIKCAFFHFKTGTHGFSDPVQYMDKDNSKGFVILLSRLAKEYSLDDYRRFQHVITQRLMDYRYVVKVSDIRSTYIGSQLQKTYRYYHKPSLKIQQSMPINQLFGNITTELILRDDEPYLLRIMAHKYSDRNYADAEGLDKMMEVILS